MHVWIVTLGWLALFLYAGRTVRLSERGGDPLQIMLAKGQFFAVVFIAAAIAVVFFKYS